MSRTNTYYMIYILLWLYITSSICKSITNTRLWMYSITYMVHTIYRQNEQFLYNRDLLYLALKYIHLDIKIL